MWFFYLFPLLSVAIGAVLWVKNKEVTWWEWLAGSAIGFLLALVFHGIIVSSMTSDIETWSGQVVSATHYPWWKERYTVQVAYTTGSGKNRTTHYRTETRYRSHPEHWKYSSTLGTGFFGSRISEAKYNEISRLFRCPPVTTSARKSGFVKGDRNVYVVTNKSGHVIPVVTTKRWTNKVQASPSVFTFVKVPESVKVFDYPNNPSVFQSGRLLGVANALGLYEWDQMNARLGPVKKVNVVMVGFPAGSDTMLGQYQEAKWIGGKKNDLVITFAGLPGKVPEWVYTFGWTEQEIVKRQLDAIVGQSVIGATLIPKIEKEVRANYTIKDWDKFDYLSIEPPGWTYVLFVILLVAAQAGFYVFAHMNEFKTKEGW